jgi:hypothetical protein
MAREGERSKTTRKVTKADRVIGRIRFSTLILSELAFFGDDTLMALVP